MSATDFKAVSYPSRVKNFNADPNAQDVQSKKIQREKHDKQTAK